MTSIFNYIFQKSGVCIRSLRASFPQPLSRGKGKRVLTRPMEEEVEISAISAFQLAHAIVKEARETNEGLTKGGCTILDRLASLRSAGYGNGGPNFIIPRDFPPTFQKQIRCGLGLLCTKSVRLSRGIFGRRSFWRNFPHGRNPP